MAAEPSLELLLEQTGAALLAGDLAELETLGRQTETALEDGIAPDLAAAERLRSLADRNGTLLTAALRGIKAAQRRAAEIAGHGRFATYNAQGHKDVLGSTPDIQARRV